ncbi:hypothetical protein O0I10_007281 [Lichtheimia ornata]|uniref:Uncharacterized protein n=1 Tax=Lichtheimia ornata TaxID=688661 RepID=A0AAD7Y0A3_9FUNG|nr:uncharacterized protein O0I10_007281 [Lichtheimia ornata]KAJ8656947.1 hypothetical protein O0I10_007281 [Lichtheimia ornata]
MVHYAFLTFDSAGHVYGIINLADKILQANPDVTGTIYIACTKSSKWVTTNVGSNPLHRLRVIKLYVEPDGDDINVPFIYSLEQPDQLANDMVDGIKNNIGNCSSIGEEGHPVATITDMYGSHWGLLAARKLGVKSYIYMPTPILKWSVLRLLPQVRDKGLDPQHGTLTIPHYRTLQHAQLPQMGDMIDALVDQCEQAKYHDGMLTHDQEETYSIDYITSLHQFIPKT